MIAIEHRINKMGIQLALISAALGLLQVLIYAIYPNDNSLIIGFTHLYPTVLAHGILLLCILGKALYRKTGLKETAMTVFIMLLNIPLAFFCAYLVLDVLM